MRNVEGGAAAAAVRNRQVSSSVLKQNCRTVPVARVLPGGIGEGTFGDLIGYPECPEAPRIGFLRDDDNTWSKNRGEKNLRDRVHCGLIGFKSWKTLWRCRAGLDFTGRMSSMRGGRRHTVQCWIWFGYSGGGPVSRMTFPSKAAKTSAADSAAAA